MAFRYDAPIQRETEFREVFRNRYITGFSIGPIVWTFFNLFFGLIFSVIFLLFIGFIALQAFYVIFGLDLYPPLDIKSTIEEAHPTLGGILAGIITFVIGSLVLATFVLHNLYVVKRRLLDRLYLHAGRPLGLIEGKPIFEPDSESGYSGIEVGEFYFGFDDCWLDVDDEDLEKLERAGGAMRIWFIPTGMRCWNLPRTGKLVKYNCTLVRAEWRSLN